MKFFGNGDSLTEIWSMWAARPKFILNIFLDKRKNIFSAMIFPSLISITSNLIAVYNPPVAGWSSCMLISWAQIQSHLVINVNFSFLFQAKELVPDQEVVNCRCLRPFSYVFDILFFIQFRIVAETSEPPFLYLNGSPPIRGSSHYYTPGLVTDASRSVTRLDRPCPKFSDIPNYFQIQLFISMRVRKPVCPFITLSSTRN